MNSDFPFGGVVTRGADISETEQLRAFALQLACADAVFVGAGAGLSTAAGLTYSGERFERYFSDFAREYGIRDMYSGGFYPFPDEETRWAWWSRHIYYNRYVDPPRPVYPDLLELLDGKDYFVLTTNVDHQFQRAGFDKRRLFYTQGDYGLFQSADPAIGKTYDNERDVMRMMEAQGFVRDGAGVFQPPEDGSLRMRVPSSLVPVCPDDGGEVTLNLRSDDTFVEDEGWHEAQARYRAFADRHATGRVLYLELGVGLNTPVIVKLPFWRATLENPQAFYVCVNLGEAYCPVEIADRALCVDRDIADVLQDLRKETA